MHKLQKFLDAGFLLALILIPFIPTFNRIDIIGPQYLYLSLIVVIFLFLKSFSLSNFEFKFNYSSKFYLLFLLIALISFVKSMNISEAIIDFTKYIITFFVLVITYSIYYGNKFYLKISLILLILFLFLETSYILYLFIENYSYESPPGRLRVFQGLAYNQNIAALSILAKIPLVLFTYFISKKKTHKIILSLLLFISVFDILVIGTRSAIYGLIIYMIFITYLYWNKFGLKFKNISISTILLILISSFCIQNILYTNSKSLKVIDRSQVILDYSTNYRLNLWEKSIEILMDNPLMGIGIGNWKIESIKYAKDFITKYEVPKHAHNDFLQIFAETGLVGGTFFLLVFISPLYFILKNFKQFENKDKLFIYFMMFSLVSIGIDHFFNFPRVRPYSLLNLFWVLAFIYTIKSFEKKK
jgi:O-antigen ligase